MTDLDPNQTEQAAFAEGYAGVSLGELARMPDAELATWQSGWRPGTDKHILAEKEWQRRTAQRELREQFKLEERLANANRWWAMGVAVIGVIGTLAGVWLGKYLELSGQQVTAQKVQTQTASPALTQQKPSGSSATSPTSSSAGQPAKENP